MTVINVRHDGGDRFTVGIRGHDVVLDQPIGDGGTDLGPSPTELFVGALAACVGHYARRYLARHGLPEEGLEVCAEFEIVARPARIGPVAIRLTVPPGVPDDRREALLAVASACTLHHTLEDPPVVTVDLVDAEDEAA